MELSDLDKEIGGMMCFQCRHFDETVPFRCAAFRDEIPDEIWHGTHTEPYPGDHGIVFDELSEEEMETRRQRIGRKEELVVK